MSTPTIKVGTWWGVKGGFFLGGLFGLFVGPFVLSLEEAVNPVLVLASLFFGALYGAGAGLALGALAAWLLSRANNEIAIKSIRLWLMGGILSLGLVGVLVGARDVGEGEILAFLAFTAGPPIVAAGYASYVINRVYLENGSTATAPASGSAPSPNSRRESG